MYNRFLQDDNLERGRQISTFFNYTSGKAAKSTSVLVNGFSNIGERRVTLCNKTRRSKGKLPPNPVEHQKLTSTCTYGNSTLMEKYNGQMRINRIIAGHSAAFIAQAPTSLMSIPPIGSTALAQLVNARAKVNEAEANIGLMLAEGRETLAMLLNPLNALRKELRSMVAGRRGRGLKTLSDAWLEYRYGIIPLLSDVDTLRRLGTAKLNVASDVSEKRSSITVTSIPYTVSRFQGILCGSAFATGTHSVEVKTIYRATSLYSYNLSTLANIGLDASSIPSTLYELIPYSFVLDWFVDVGSWIKAITPHPGIVDMGNVVSAKTTRTDETCIDTMHVNQFPTQDYPASPHNSVLTCSSVGYQRSVNNVLPKLPGINPRLLSMVKVTDALALSLGLCKRQL